jgi:uncharacterized cupin superfamily protein
MKARRAEAKSSSVDASAHQSRGASVIKPVINVSQAMTHTSACGKFFAYSMTELASALGAHAIGANITRVPPGKAAFPFHHHYANEEHFFVLSGVGVLRHGPDIHEIKKDDYIVNLAGGPDRAHQLINTGNEDLVYLAISTNVIPEVWGYPDSSKTGVRTAPCEEANSRFLIPDACKDTVGSWDFEDDTRVADVVAGRQNLSEPAVVPPKEL